jgi:hypothetical protein
MSRPRFVTTYLALAVLAGLVALLYFTRSKAEPGKDAKPKEKVLALDKAKVKELQLKNSSSEAIRLVKEGGAWRVAAPFTAPADSGEVDSLVSSVESLESDEVIAESPGDLKEFGLDSPRTVVSLLQEGASEPLKLLLGDKTPDGGSVYAKLPSQPRIFTIPAYLQSSFEKKPFELRDRDLLHVKRDAVKTLEIAGPEGSFALARDDKGEWSFTRPLPTRAGRWSVDSLLGLLESLRMESIAAEEAKDPKAFGLAKPQRSVVLALADGSRKTLEIGSSVEEPADKATPKGKDIKKPAAKTPSKEGDVEKPDTPAKPGKYYAREAGSALVAVIPGALVGDLAKGMKELRAKRLLDVATYEVEGFDVETPDGKKVYARSSTKDKEGVDVYHWKRASPDGADVDTNKVQDVLFLVGGVEVQEFLDAPAAPAVYGLDKPALRAGLRHDGGKPATWFEVGEQAGASYGTRPHDQAMLRLDPAKAAELLKKFKEL